MKRIITALFTISLCLALSLAAFADGGERTPPSPSDPVPTPPPVTDLIDEEGEASPDSGISLCETDTPKDTCD